MKSIDMAERYKDKVLSGKKKMTIRMGRRAFKKGEVVELTCGGEHLGFAIITDVIYVRFSDLSDEDAYNDGFSSRDELIRELSSIYGDIKGSTIMTKIKFKLIRKYRSE